MSCFYLVRHGNTELNKRDILQGHIDSPLTKRGLDDALFIAKKLKGKKFDAIVSSDLGRAFITAHIIGDRLGFSSFIQGSKELREIDYGSLTARFKKEVILNYNHLKSSSTVKAPNGESHQDVKRRVLKKIFSLAKNYDNLLVVTHNNCIRSIISEAFNKNLDSFLKMEISHRFIAKFDVKDKKIFNFEIIHQ